MDEGAWGLLTFVFALDETRRRTTLFESACKGGGASPANLSRGAANQPADCESAIPHTS